jgi:hypothetical protein
MEGYLFSKYNNDKDDKMKWYFTFGHGHEHFGKYIIIEGEFNEARKRMFSMFGSKWSMQYDEVKGKEIVEKWDLKSYLKAKENQENLVNAKLVEDQFAKVSITTL